MGQAHFTLLNWSRIYTVRFYRFFCSFPLASKHRILALVSHQTSIKKIKSSRRGGERAERERERAHKRRCNWIESCANYKLTVCHCICETNNPMCNRMRRIKTPWKKCAECRCCDVGRIRLLDDDYYDGNNVFSFTCVWLWLFSM